MKENNFNAVHPNHAEFHILAIPLCIISLHLCTMTPFHHRVTRKQRSIILQLKVCYLFLIQLPGLLHASVHLMTLDIDADYSFISLQNDLVAVASQLVKFLTLSNQNEYCLIVLLSKWVIG